MIGRRELLKALVASPMAGWLRSWGPVVPSIGPDLDASAHYRRAFGRLATLTEADNDLIRGRVAVPLDDAVDDLLRRLAPALDDLGRGASQEECGWAEVVHIADLISGDRDIGNLRVGKVALLRARKLAEAGRPREALDDVFAAASFGRHLGHAGLLISRLWQFAMENEAIATLAAILPKLGTSALASIPARISALPAPCSWAETMRLVGRFIASTVAEKVEASRDPLDLEALKDVFLEEAEARAFLEATGGDRGRILALIRDVEPHLAGLAEVLELPRGPFEAALGAFKGRPGGLNPIARSVVDQADHIRFAADRTALLWTMLRAARTLIVDGPDRFRLIADPFGDGPFARVEFAGGFELRSALQGEGKPPAIVRVGRRPG